MLRRTVDGTIDNLGETHHLSQERIFFFSRAFSIWFVKTDWSVFRDIIGCKTQLAKVAPNRS